MYRGWGIRSNRSTLLSGTVVQQQGERTGALPGRVISSIG